MGETRTHGRKQTQARACMRTHMLAQAGLACYHLRPPYFCARYRRIAPLSKISMLPSLRHGICPNGCGFLPTGQHALTLTTTHALTLTRARVQRRAAVDVTHTQTPAHLSRGAIWNGVLSS